jgi:hypothetical protein
MEALERRAWELALGYDFAVLLRALLLKARWLKEGGRVFFREAAVGGSGSPLAGSEPP